MFNWFGHVSRIENGRTSKYWMKTKMMKRNQEV